MKQTVIDGPTDDTQAVEEPTEEAAETTADESTEFNPDPLVVEDLNRTRIELAEAMKDEADKKRIHKAAKDRVESLSEREHDLVNELFDGRSQPGLPFNGSEEESWRRVHISELLDHGAPKATLSLLAEKKPELNTLGALSDWLNDSHELQEIDGIGVSKADAVKDAMTAWFAAHPDMCPPVKSEDSTDMSLIDVVDEEDDDEEQPDAA